MIATDALAAAYEKAAAEENRRRAAVTAAYEKAEETGDTADYRDAEEAAREYHEWGSDELRALLGLLAGIVRAER